MVSGLLYTCTGSHRPCGLSVVAIWNYVGESCAGFVFFLYVVVFSVSAVLILSAFLFSPLLSQCEGHPDVSVYGLMAGLQGFSNHGSVLLSRGWLITVKAPGHPRHPPSTPLDAVVNVLVVD